MSINPILKNNPYALLAEENKTTEKTLSLSIKINLLCPLWFNHRCQEGHQCPFLHEGPQQKNQPLSPDVFLCKDYHVHGFCSSGTRCHLLHEIPRLPVFQAILFLGKHMD